MKLNVKSNISSKLLLNILVFSFFSVTIFSSNFGIAFAQETGEVDVLVEGYDGNTVMNVALYNSSLSILKNMTINEPTFNFENLSIGEQYLILIDYNGVTYHEQIWINQTSQSLTIHVFDITSDDEDLIVQVHHIAVSSGDNYLNVTEYLEFTNFGNTVINNTAIKIELPDGFKNFIWNQACCIEPTDFGIFFRLIEPLLPNETKSINFKYRLEPTSNEYSFEKKIYYDTALVILTVDSTNELSVISWDNLQSEGLVDVGDEMFDAYSIPSIFKGQRFSLVFTGYKETSEINLLWIGTGILVVLGAGGIVFAFRRSGTSIEQLKSEENTLTSELEKIEKDYSNGNIKEVEYLTLKLKNKTTLEKVKSGIQEEQKVKNE